LSVACNWPVLIKVVVRMPPFHRTVELNTKFEPKTVRGIPAPWSLNLREERGDGGQWVADADGERHRVRDRHPVPG
jgi:hypothetical protein